MKKLFFALTLMSTAAAGQQKIFLYADKKGQDAPFMEFLKAPKSNGTTILVCPGGGYTALAADYEGTDVAKFYNLFGFDAWVLHYRLNNDEQTGSRYPDQYNDITTAIRMVKSKAKDPNKVGVLGFSAGGHLASMGATMHAGAEKDAKDVWMRYDSRPAFAILIYPVIAMSGEIAHQGSRTMLLGKNPNEKLADSLSTQNRVDRNTPPTFIVYSTDDDVVMVENGIRFYEALHKNHVPATIHIFDHGGHGYGMAPKDPVIGTWPKLSVDWLRSLNLK
jgi:acetyl esterase/lipase